MKQYKILIVDDEEETRDIFSRQLQDIYSVETASSAKEAIGCLETENFPVVLTDLAMPEMNGIELLRIIKKRWPFVSVIVISGKASIGMAVEAIKLGAEEFIEKPVEDLELLNIYIEKILRVKWQSQELERLKRQLEDGFQNNSIFGNSLVIQKILEKIKKISAIDSSVLITGETGVGKELFAEVIYQNSNRSNQKYVVVNCGSLPENLLESTLFGHKKGSFTGAVSDKVGYFQEADGGTLFLDEITETTPAFQVKLLRALENGVIRRVGGEEDIKIDVRVIAATNKNLEEMVNEGVFRQDLYYRLNVIHFQIPPLRERPEDIKVLANRFLSQLSEKYSKQCRKISQPALAILLENKWNGNVRELKNAIEHAVALCYSDRILPEDLPDSLFKPTMTDTNSIKPFLAKPFAEAKNRFEERYIRELLTRYLGDVTRIAEVSGIQRQNLYEKFKRYHIDPRKFRDLS